MTSWHSYPKVYNLGHRILSELLNGPITVEEKVDGSQFSFGIFNGELKCRSKNCELVLDANNGMFTKAVQTVKELAPLLKDGYTYRGEYLNEPKHNALSYNRTPTKNIIIYDVNPAEEHYLSYAEKKAEAERLGLEVVPLIYEGNGLDLNLAGLKEILEKTSVLGEQKIEGVVIKNYTQFGPDKKALLGKHVSEAFKEVHKKTWGESNPNGQDIITRIGQMYKTEARWNKAVQHLKEQGALTGTPRDIGSLLKEVQTDILAECTDEIKQELFKWAWGDISRIVISGLPYWYKDELMKSQFTTEDK